MQKDMLSSVYRGQVNGQYLTVQAGDFAAKPLEAAVTELRRELAGRHDALEAAIRRTDKHGHPRVCAWTRKKVQDPWTFSWEIGADNPAATPLRL
jgi:hypothetical protein